MIDEVLESPMFYILAGLGVACELAGWLFSRRVMDYSLPIWQLLILIVVTIAASAFFALQD